MGSVFSWLGVNRLTPPTTDPEIRSGSLLSVVPL